MYSTFLNPLKCTRPALKLDTRVIDALNLYKLNLNGQTVDLPETLFQLYKRTMKLYELVFIVRF